MTRIALIADAHANIYGLRAALAAIDAAGVDAIFDLGDAVNYGPHPNEVVDCLRGRGIPSVRGNHDEKVLAFGSRREEYARTKRPHKFASFRFTYETLRPDNRAWLAGQPLERRLRVEDVEVILLHTLPPDLRERVDASPPAPADAAFGRVVGWGHSHAPSIKALDDALYVNAGSAGRLERAAYAIVFLESGRARAEVRWADYDRRALRQDLLASPLPDAFLTSFGFSSES